MPGSRTGAEVLSISDRITFLNNPILEIFSRRASQIANDTCRLALGIAYRLDRGRFTQRLAAFHECFRLPFKPCYRQNDRHYERFIIESLKTLLCLNAAMGPLLLSDAVRAGTTPAYIYSRTGSNQDATGMAGLGGLALEGGGTDVDAAFQWMISRMGGKGDFLVLSAVKSTAYNSYIYKMRGVNSVASLDIPSISAAKDPAVKAIIASADAIFISGGDQSKYLNFWKGTPVQAALNAPVASGVPLGGTSAGTDVMG